MTSFICNLILHRFKMRVVENVGFEPLLLLPKQVCYRYTTFSIWLRRWGLNPRPLGYEPSKLTSAILRNMVGDYFITPPYVMVLLHNGGANRTWTYKIGVKVRYVTYYIIALYWCTLLTYRVRNVYFLCNFFCCIYNSTSIMICQQLFCTKNCLFFMRF